MRQYLKARLSPQNFRRAVTVYSWTLSLKAACCAAIATVCILLLRTLPKHVQAFIRERFIIVVPMDYAKTEIRLLIDSSIEYLVRQRSCKKEPETIAWIEEAIVPGDVVYDIGANVGVYSFVIDQHTHGHAKIYCFEPGALNWQKLNQNILLNGCHGRLIALPVALSDRKAIGTFCLSSPLAGAAFHALGSAGDCAQSNVTQQNSHPVLSYTLDQFVEEFGLDCPNHIKIDVDGQEFKVLTGARRTMSRPELKSVLIEIDNTGDNGVKIMDYMKELGFLPGKPVAASRPQARWSNCVFIRAAHGSAAGGRSLGSFAI